MTVSLPAARISQTASLPWLVRVTAISCLFGAEAIDAAVIEEHISEWLPAGLFFIGLSLVQGLLAVTLIVAPSSRVARLTIGVSLATVALWLYSRTVGLPFGPMAWTAEPIGRADAIATFFELVTVAVLLATTTVTTSTTTVTTSTPRSAVDYCRAFAIVSAVFVLITFGQISVLGHH